VHGVALTLAAFAIVAALLAWSRRLARRRAAALGHLALAATCAALAAAVGSLAATMDAYPPLVTGRPIAEVRFDGSGNGRHRAMVLHLPDGRVQVLELSGDQWRVTARTLQWQDWIARLGARPHGRLERIESGREGRPIQVYRLEAPDPDGAATPETGVWSGLVTTPTVDTGWQPVADRTEYRLRVAADRIEVEPIPGGPTLSR
jgi:hypothetical protein